MPGPTNPDTTSGIQRAREREEESGRERERGREGGRGEVKIGVNGQGEAFQSRVWELGIGGSGETAFGGEGFEIRICSL
jgi:hypothetical protein